MTILANGLRITGDDPTVAASLDTLEADLLRYGRGVAEFLEGPAPGSGSALGNAYAAAIHLFAMSAEGRARAAPLIAIAQGLAHAATEHERIIVAGVAAWASGDLRRATALHLEAARRFPDDLVSAKICQFHQLNAGAFAGMLACTTALVEARPENGYVQGMHAFALEQMGDACGAERAGRIASAMNHDPWAHHAVAHVLDTAGRAGEGQAWMADHAPLWDDCSSFLYTHNWWHAALFEIALGDHAAALHLFDNRVWGVRRDCCQDQINAVSLLVRFELLGIDVGDRWTDLAPHLALRIDDRANAFIDLHFAYGLARAGHDHAVGEQLGAMRRIAAAVGDPGKSAFRHAVLTAAEGMVAHARRDFARAASALTTIRDTCVAFGGSRTQRRLVDLIREDSIARARGFGGRRTALAGAGEHP